MPQKQHILIISHSSRYAYHCQQIAYVQLVLIAVTQGVSWLKWKIDEIVEEEGWRIEEEDDDEG